MTLDVSVIIVNYKTISLITDAIDSVFNKSEGINLEIIVVDNNSHDDSQRIIRTKYGNMITYIPLPENIGFGRANNEGIKVAKGRNILFLNPDTLLINNAIQLLSEYLDRNPEVGIVGANLYSPDMLPNTSFNRTLPSIFDEADQASLRLLSRIFYGKNTLFNHTDRPMPVGFIVGADMMVRKEILSETGNFDPDFFMYYEETELTWRIKKAGYKVFNIPQARIIHFEGKSFTQSHNRETLSLTSRRIYLNKTHCRTYCRIADIHYYLITVAGLVISYITNNDAYKSKLTQRLRILNKIKKNDK